MKKVRIPIFILATLIGIFMLGPRPHFVPSNPTIPPSGFKLEELDSLVEKAEHLTALKPDNQARIIWADSIRQTEYAIVYLHGLSASQEEGNPLHRALAKRFGCNLYLSRLPCHGETDPDAFKTISPEALIEGAKQSIKIGKTLGKKVIVIGCSTGGTLGVYLAAANQADIYALMLYSPNIEIADPKSAVLTWPWARQMASMASGGDYHHWDATEAQQAYWQTTYCIEGLLAVKALIKETMTYETFKGVTQPVFMGYYYKDEEHQDQVVSVPAMLDFFDKISTPAAQKEKLPFQMPEPTLSAANSFHKMWRPFKLRAFVFVKKFWE